MIECIRNAACKPHTNADRIRNMSDEELAEFIEQISTDSMETISFGTKEYKEIWERKETALEWLQPEAEYERIWKIDIYTRQRESTMENGWKVRYLTEKVIVL